MTNVIQFPRTFESALRDFDRELEIFSRATGIKPNPERGAELQRRYFTVETVKHLFADHGIQYVEFN